MTLSLELKIVGIDKASEDFLGLSRALTEQQPALFRSLGDALVSDVKRRIMTSDGGAWAPCSKWLKAKSGQSKVLLGAEKFVRAKVTEAGLRVVGKSGKWTLTQHHEGFENDLADNGDKFDAFGRVIIKIKDAAPLALYQEFRQKRDGTKVPRAAVFAFVPKRAGKTPARKIWTGGEEARAIIQPIASRWLNKIVEGMVR